MESLIVDNLRVLSLYEIENAKSGHPGVALSSAPILYSLYGSVMNYSPKDDKSIFRDRFVLSAGHASSLLYATLHMFGFDISIQDLKQFRKLNSITPGHPEFNKTPGVDCSTGPLGQGVSNAVGLALASKYYQAKFNKKDIKLFDNKIYCLVGDGCLMEGISYEATNLAGTLNLDNLILIYDCNKRTIDGSIDITFVEDVKKRFESINFNVLEVENGNNSQQITNALLKAKQSNKPSIVIVNTILGYGSEFEDMSVVHGTPLNLDQIEYVKQKLNINVAPFEVLEEVKNEVDFLKEKINQRYENQLSLLDDYKKKYPKDYAKLLDYMNFAYNEKAIRQIKNFNSLENLPFKQLNHELFSAFRLDNLLGGSADVETTTKMFNKFDEIFNKNNYLGKRICFGVREHAMAGICNGICLFGGLMNYASCFLSFSDYLKPSIRMSALMNLPVLYVFSHDNFLNGEDGPTHQPVEQLVSLRTIPNLAVFRAYNLDELKCAYEHFLQSKKPTCILFSKVQYPMQKSLTKNVKNGGYVIEKFGKNAKITLVSSGSDINIALQTAKLLYNQNLSVKVVSMPCTQIFDSQSLEYKNKVLGKYNKVFTIESASPIGLIKYVNKGMALGIENFGKSALPSQLLNFYEFTPEKIFKKILNFLNNN